MADNPERDTMISKDIENLVELAAIRTAEAAIAKAHAEIKALVELTAIQAADAAIEKAKIEWTKDITIYSAQCEVKKLTGIKHFFSACVGGGIVAVITWILSKL